MFPFGDFKRYTDFQKYERIRLEIVHIVAGREETLARPLF